MLQSPNLHGPTNHWLLYLILKVRPGSRSHKQPLVLLDMDTVAGRPEGKLRHVSRVAIKDQTAKVKSIDVVAGTTVSDLVSLLASNGREKFRFNPNVEGCAHWCTEVLHDLVTARFIPEHQAQECVSSAQYIMNRYWVKGRSQGTPRPFQYGTFY
ncbi:hypothetical protein TWF281_004053 [Arthrobotrys megalospora]